MRLVAALLAAVGATVMILAPGASQARISRSGASTPALPLSTGVLDPWSFGGQDGSAAFEHLRRAGARYARLLVYWSGVAPPGAVRPAGFDARNPGDPQYRWAETDRQVKLVASSGFAPIIYVTGAPSWAQNGERQRSSDGSVRPSNSDLADFFSAFAGRFSGIYEGLPRIRYWQIWNEPNLSIELMPQTENGKLVSPALYRDMVNAAAVAIHAVHRDNVVVAGGLAPFGGNLNDPSGGPVEGQERIRPLQFMREMLCMSKGAKPKPTCDARVEFDVWAHHPYTYGGPTHSAFHPDDVSMGDLAEMRRLLEAAEKAGNIRSRQRVAYWVTEFSYDSQPADPKGLQPMLHARWTSEALFRMWQNGVSLVTWFLLRDQPFPDQMFQSGLYLRGPNGIASDRPKPALRAFRFPFVAFKQKDKSITFWGRTPTSSKKAVVIEQKHGAMWKRLATPTVDRYGIFQGRVTSKSSGSFRARLVSGGEASLPFSLTVPKDFRFCPWGSYC